MAAAAIGTGASPVVFDHKGLPISARHSPHSRCTVRIEGHSGEGVVHNPCGSGSTSEAHHRGDHTRHIGHRLGQQKGPKERLRQVFSWLYSGYSMRSQDRNPQHGYWFSACSMALVSSVASHRKTVVVSTSLWSSSRRTR